MTLKFCANLGFLFHENSAGLLQRYAAAAAAGLRAVEGPFPEGIVLEDVHETLRSAGISQVLMNIKTSDIPNGQFGAASFPDAHEQFRVNFDETLKYAKVLGIKKIHVMAGKLDGPSTPANDKAYLENLTYVAGKLASEEIIAVIEPINKYSVPGYYLNDYIKAVDILRSVNSPKVKLMIDIFHMQLIQGNVLNSIRELSPFLGHVQIAQAPNRNEPETAGELNFSYIFNLLKEVGYDDWIGMEYKPLTTTVEGLNWIRKFGFDL